MEFIYTMIFTTLAILSMIIISLSHPKHGLNLPPGPPCWPIFGNLLQLASSGKPFFLYIKELIPIYGPIITLKMGARTMVILSQADLVHEALIEKGQVFATRPPENPTRIMFSCNKFSINAALYGPVWRSLRRNLVQNTLATSRFHTFREVRVNAMDKLVDRLEEAVAIGGAVWVLKNARFVMLCILLTMCLGVEIDEEMIEKIDDMMKKVLMTIHPRLDDFLPLLRPFFLKQRKQAVEVREQQIALLAPLIKRRRAVIDNPGTKPRFEFSYLDTLQFKDTTATAIEWAIAMFIESPSIQLRLYNEIKSIVGDKKVDENDVDNMPYLNAFVKELLRKHPPSYILLTHSVTEPVKLAGYDIPVGTQVEIYLPGITEDPKIWSNPDRFDPDRFLTCGETADISGVTGVKMIPLWSGTEDLPRARDGDVAC
nr:cytochrome P450 77A2-like [Tanacetum cinerariifolium]